MNGLPGFYGKLPAHGDFVQRRLSAEFVARWDRWLQESMLAARAALEPNWTGHYLAAPAWQFALAPGCIDQQGWIGLVLPSRDRVGRQFPLTIALPQGVRFDPLAALAGAGAWFGALEQVVRHAIAQALELQAFESDLARLGPAPLAAAPDLALEDETKPLPLGGPARPLAWRMNSAGDYGLVPGALAALRRPACVLAGGAPRTVLALELLPEPALAVALFDGQWAAHGWRYEDHDATRKLAPGVAGAGDLTRPLPGDHLI